MPFNGQNKSDQLFTVDRLWLTYYSVLLLVKFQESFNECIDGISFFNDKGFLSSCKFDICFASLLIDGHDSTFAEYLMNDLCTDNNLRVFDIWDENYLNSLLSGSNVIYTRNNESIQSLMAQQREVLKSSSPDAYRGSVLYAGVQSQEELEKNSDRDNLQAEINNEEKILDILDSLRTKGISAAQDKAIAQLINLASSTDQIVGALRDVARLSGNSELERLHAIERMIKRENSLKSQIAAAEEMVQREKANTEKVNTVLPFIRPKCTRSAS